MLLQIKNLNSGFGKISVLKDVCLELKDGEILALIGPNGAGKSTVLKSLFGLADIESGDIFYMDQNITYTPPHDLLKMGISYVPQGRLIFPHLRVIENLAIGAYLEKDKQIIQQRLKDILKLYPVLKDKQNQKACNLSGGQQQVLALARSLMYHPKVLLLDEPSLGLSPKIIQELFYEITNINKQGVSCIIVEQNVHHVLKIADRGYVLVAGQIRYTGTPEDLLDKERLKQLYLS